MSLKHANLRLRHPGTDHSLEPEDFIAIGFSCTLFRDDEKADFIDESRHLIIHPEDETLSTDRFDGRLCLHNLTEYDATTVGRNAKSEFEEEERQFDPDRYMDMYETQSSDEDTANNSCAAVPPPSDYFNPDSPSSSQMASYFKEKQQRKENRLRQRPFVAPENLDIPEEMELPKTARSHIIIAKTASFVATKGPQMEIVIKAKQGTTTNFEFLEFGNILRPYYEFILTATKAGRFQLTGSEDGDDESDESDEDADYLHPSLLGSSLKRDVEPPESMKPIIDRLAEYVARNGTAVLNSLKKSPDDLYAFVESGHPHHAYYCQQLSLFHSYYESQRLNRLAEDTMNKAITLIKEKKMQAVGNNSPKSAEALSPKPEVAPKRNNDESDDRKAKKSRLSQDGRSSAERSDHEGTSDGDVDTVSPKPEPRNGNSKNNRNAGESDETISIEDSVCGDRKDNQDDELALKKKLQEERRAKAKRFLSLLQHKAADDTATPSDINK